MKTPLDGKYTEGCIGCTRHQRCKKKPLRVDEYIVFNEDNQQIEASKYYNCIMLMCAWMHLYDEKNSPVLNPDEAARIRRKFQKKLEAAGWKRIEFIEVFGKSYL